jgi:hypothetical protein
VGGLYSASRSDRCILELIDDGKRKTRSAPLREMQKTHFETPDEAPDKALETAGR